MSTFRKSMMRFQAFLLRNNLMGPAGNFLMALKVKGRISNKSYSIPVGYLENDEIVYAINPEGKSQWFKNIKINPEVIISVKGQSKQAIATVIESEDERLKVFRIYKEKQANIFSRLFFVSVDAPQKELDQAMKNTIFVKFAQK